MSILVAFTAASLAAVPALPATGPTLAFRHGDAPVMTHRRPEPRDGHRRLPHRGGSPIFFYDRDYQGDSAWRSGSFNDWWHEDTSRSYPRWLQNNANCERQWYAGDTLRC